MDNVTRLIENLLVNITEAKNGTNGSASQIGLEYTFVYNIYLYLMMVLGVFGNAIVLVVFYYYRPSTTTDWYILFITICDFISSLVNVPVYSTFTNGYWRIFGNTTICRLHMFLSQSICLSSSFLICGLALDRYFKICKKLKSYTSTRARNACLLITVVTTVLSVPALIMFENRAGLCEPVIMNAALFLYYVMVFMIFVIATGIVVFSYCKVTKTVLKSEENLYRHERHERRSKKSCNIPTSSKVPDSMVTTEASTDASVVETPISSCVSTKEANGNVEMPRPKEMQNSPERGIPSVSGQLSHRNTTQKQIPSNLETIQRNSGRISKISFLVCSVFILSWLPPWTCFVLAAIPNMKKNVNVLKFMLFGKMSYLINGVLNPAIYAWMNRQFRSRIRRIFCRNTV